MIHFLSSKNAQLRTMLRKTAAFAVLSSFGLTLLSPFQQVQAMDQADESPVYGKNVRPPQYIALAFDGSYDLSRWNDSINFADTVTTSDGKEKLKFSYFISGVYFLLDDYRLQYQGPKHVAGKSDIGFGDNNPTRLLNRIGFVNKAYLKGHEIGSHANGHFDAETEKWTQTDWADEFKSFYHLIFDAFTLNKLSPTAGQTQKWAFDYRTIRGFRAPLLGTTAGLWPVLEKNNFTYDTSLTDKMDYWPQKTQQGFWNFPLSQINVAGTAKKTISMDYNFYLVQSQGKNVSNLSKTKAFETQMYNSYIQYFLHNYNGNRAPINIGHHFGPWNNNAYWNALLKFAKQVCGLPEVHCVSYAKLTKEMETISRLKLLADYQAGKFPKKKGLSLADEAGPKTKKISLKVVSGPTGFHAMINGKDKAEVANPTQIHWELDGKLIHSGTDLNLKDHGPKFTSEHQLSVSIHAPQADGEHVEVLRATHVVHANAPGANGLIMAKSSLESRAMKGDLPEAHHIERTGSTDVNLDPDSMIDSKPEQK